MSKQEIIELVEKSIAGQWNQVDSGGKLADILKSIVDIIPETPEPVEPLIVPGYDNDGQFESAPGAASWEEAKAAYIAGRPVYLQITAGNALVLVSIFVDDEAGEGLYLGAFTSGGDILVWPNV